MYTTNRLVSSIEFLGARPSHNYGQQPRRLSKIDGVVAAKHRSEPRDLPLSSDEPSTSGTRACSTSDPSLFIPLSGLPQLRAPPGQSSLPGKVYLVGTGPGDPGLLTLRAVQLMQAADVVLYDRLVSTDILRLVHGNARMIYVGKEKGMHTRTQEEIHHLLHRWASDVKVVVRLKGGDPFIFGRGGEEAEYLRQRGVEVHCIPGITAASGICAELGIPMTHRGVATSVRYLTGHVREGGQSDLDESLLVCNDPHTTLIIYMGLQSLPALVDRLSSLGMPPTMPAVAVERGTTPEQRVVYAPVAQLVADVQKAALQSPTLIIVGKVVACAPGWEAAFGSTIHQIGTVPMSV